MHNIAYTLKKRGTMLKYYRLIILVFTITLALALLGSCTQTETAKIKVMTGTSLVTAIVEEVGGNHVEAINLVPPNQHPGNFDMKPDDIQKLSTAKLFLLQGLPGETYADKLIASANNPNLTVIKANVPGNWMIPSIQASAVDKVLNALIEVDPDNTADYQAAAVKYQQAVTNKGIELEGKLVKANVGGIKVIASSRQADFLQWAGFQVVGTFDSAAGLTPQAVKDLVDKGKANGVKLVVNNLQDSEDAGKGIAASLGAKNLNLSNFPGGFSNTATWAQAVDYNVNLLLNAIK
jgi:zinc transport system substrate-binding protein